MTSDLISQGGDIIGTRISVFNLLPQFLDASSTESFLCRSYELTPEQVAAARAYIFNNLETVLAQHLKIEARIAAGNSREVAEAAERTRAAMRSFQEWRTLHRQPEQEVPEATSTRTGNTGMPNFRDWLAQQESLIGEGS